MVEERARTLLVELYGPETGEAACRDLLSLLARYRGRIPTPRRSGLNQRDTILITYADQVQEAGRPGLESLNDFCTAHLSGLVTGLHILPFFPWSSDDGFSVMDYEAVDARYGDWDDIRALGRNFRLMFDAVINHASAKGEWFLGFLQDRPEYRDFFIRVHGNPDVSQVVRPRTLPLLTDFGQGDGTRLWTTFSADQVDLNYRNPRVLLKIMDVLLFYVMQGAELIRLDAIAYLWKEMGTSCINLAQTHRVVQLLRVALDAVAPHVMLITETNVPSLENLSYFGDGTDEAQLVYNFPLPPLVLHALQTGNSSTLSRWAATLTLPSERVTFLNFLASHDGIGLNPVRGILRESEIAAMAERVRDGGGYVSNKTNANGTESPYELNVNYFDALACGDATLETDLQVRRFVTAHAILLAFAGVPAIYFHSLFGSRGWPEGVSEMQSYRAVNRQKLPRAGLEAQLADEHSVRAHIFSGLSGLLRVRGENGCFSPQASQQVLQAGEAVFALLRQDQESGACALCLHNLANSQQGVEIALGDTALKGSRELRNLISGNTVGCAGDRLSMQLEPYQTAWLANAQPAS